MRLAITRHLGLDRGLEAVLYSLMGELAAERESIRGVRITEQPPVLRHFSAVFKLRGPA